MVLDKLGSSLKETLSKIAKSLFVDEKLVNELVKDIQRALLQADVNVKLVFTLSTSIKKRALEEKVPSGISQREYLVTIVYEELTKFLGGEKNEIIIDKTKKPFKIMMVGLFGSGKCVHKDSHIVLSDGKIISAEKLYALYKTKEEHTQDGWIIPVEDQNLTVPSFNPKTLKIETKKVSHLWKLHGKELLQVSLDNGNDLSIKVTPEHPFFVLKEGQIQQVRADQLTENDFIAVPRSYEIHGQRQHLFDDLKKLDFDVESKIPIKRGTIQSEILPKLTFKRNYPQLTMDLKKGITPICLLENYNSEKIKLRKRGATHFIYFPTHLTEELAEFLGYVMGDGHLDKEGGYVDISTENLEVEERVVELTRNLFNLEVSIQKDKRRQNLKKLTISSTTLTYIVHQVFGIPLGKKGKFLSVPEKILLSKNTTIKPFLCAYFDCDAYASENKREIEFSSESKIATLQVAQLLQRFGIASSFSKKIINNIPYWRIRIAARYAEFYAEKIGFRIQYKKDRSEKYLLIGKLQGSGKQDMLPLGHSLKELRQSLGFSIGEIQEYVNSYGQYEKTGLIARDTLSTVLALYTLKKKGNFIRRLEALKDKETTDYSHNFKNGFLPMLRQEGFIEEKGTQIHLTEKAKIFLNSRGKQEVLFNLFTSLASSDVHFFSVSKIENIGSEEFVYDLTVEDNHSFIADNIIVHNTTSISKIAKYYQKRGFKIATLGLDVHRPAAPQQLKQLSDKLNIPCYINEKEKNALKIYKEFEKHYSEYDILLVDTAGRDALSEDLVQELKELNHVIQPDEKLLVISGDLGQAAQKQAESFHNSCGVTGVFITKLDGTAKGGGALSACAITGAPVKFIGTGEKPDDIEIFNPKGFVGRLLGMGDIEALLEKAQEAMSPETAEDLGKKMLKGDFNFLDLYEQMEAMGKMGPLSKIVEMIPGMGGMKIPKEMLEGQEGKLKKWKIMLSSCTKEELEDPEIITRERIDRIAKGSGTSVGEVRELLKQYKQSKKMMKMMKGMEDPEKMMKKFKGKLPKGFGA